MASENKKLVSTGSIYVVTSIITQLINLFLIPICTKNLTTSQYGQYNIIIALQGLLAIFITFGVYSGFCRFFNEYEDKNRLKNTTLTFSIACGSIFTILGILISPFIASFIFPNDIDGSEYIKYIVLSSAITSITAVYESYLSMQYKALQASLINISNMLIKIILSIYFIIILQKGVLGILEAQFLANLVIVVILLVWDIRNIKFIICKKELKQILKFSLGLIPGNASAWVLTLIDRYFIKGIINLSAVAVYSMAYKIGMLIEPVFINPFSKAFIPYKFKVYRDKNGKEKLKNVFKYFNFISWFCILGLSIFAKMFIEILSTPEYVQGFKIIPIIAFSYYLYGLGAFYCIGFQIANKTIIDSIILIFAAVINVLFNLILIPKVGIYGAAISTVISYLFTNCMYYIFGRKYYKVGIGILEPVKYGCIYVSLYIIYLLSNKISSNVYFEIVFNIILCGLYIILCIIFRFISCEKLLSLINPNDSKSSIIDITSKNNSSLSINTKINFQQIIITPDSNRAYVINPGYKDISVIDISNNVEINTISINHIISWDVGITPEGSGVYVITNLGLGVSVINMSTNIDVVNIYIENSQNGIAITPHGRVVITPNDTRAYVINSANNNVSVIDAFSNKVINTIYIKDALRR